MASRAAPSTPMAPFLSFYTPVFLRADGSPARPTALAACKMSVAAQSIGPEAIQHEIVVDAVLGGSGVEGMFAQVPANAHRMRGEYVHMLADDDVLFGPRAVQQLRDFVLSRAEPPAVVLVNSWKTHPQGWLRLPIEWAGVPVMGAVDLGCIITRRDVWQAHAADYGAEYESDFRFLDALYRAGHEIARFDLDFVQGAVMRGAAE